MNKKNIIKSIILASIMVFAISCKANEPGKEVPNINVVKISYQEFLDALKKMNVTVSGYTFSFNTIDSIKNGKVQSSSGEATITGTGGSGNIKAQDFDKELVNVGRSMGGNKFAIVPIDYNPKLENANGTDLTVTFAISTGKTSTDTAYDLADDLKAALTSTEAGSENNAFTIKFKPGDSGNWTK